jgi:hypothetical protein
MSDTTVASSPGQRWPRGSLFVSERRASARRFFVVAASADAQTFKRREAAHRTGRLGREDSNSRIQSREAAHWVRLHRSRTLTAGGMSIATAHKWVDDRSCAIFFSA